MSQAKFITAADAMDRWRDDVLTGKPPTFYRIAESGELEFGADDAFILAPENGTAGMLRLSHLKARHSKPADVLLKFYGSTQTFTAIEPPTADDWKMPGELWAGIADLWNTTEPATNSEGG